MPIAYTLCWLEYEEDGYEDDDYEGDQRTLHEGVVSLFYVKTHKCGKKDVDIKLEPDDKHMPWHLGVALYLETAVYLETASNIIDGHYALCEGGVREAERIMSKVTGEQIYDIMTFDIIRLKHEAVVKYIAIQGEIDAD